MAFFTILKGSRPLFIKYASGSICHSLTGKIFQGGFSERGVELQVNLSGNLRKRNANAACSADARRLVDNGAKLKIFEISQAEGIAHSLDGIVAKHADTNPAPAYHLTLDLGDTTHAYLVTPSTHGDKLSLKIIQPL